VISQHEFVTKVRDDLRPRIEAIEEEVRELFNQHCPPGRGIPGFSGGELEEVQLLNGTAGMLKRMASDLGLTDKGSDGRKE